MTGLYYQGTQERPSSKMKDLFYLNLSKFQNIMIKSYGHFKILKGVKNTKDLFRTYLEPIKT